MVAIKEILILSMYIITALVLFLLDLPWYIWSVTSLALYTLVRLIREKM